MAQPTPNLFRDPYIKLGHEIRTDVLQDNVRSPMPQKLAAILKKALQTDVIRERNFKDAVYVVLNYPPLGRPGERRQFVAAMNCEKIDPDIQSLLKGPNQWNRTSSEVPTCELIPFRQEDADASHWKATRQLWFNKWNEYWQITQKALEENRGYTWNQLLLKNGVLPLPVGIHWHGNTKSNGVAPYFQITSNVAASLDVWQPNTKGCQRRLLDITPEAIDRYALNTDHLTELDELTAFFNDIDENGKKHRTRPRTAWKIFHLIRSYGFWGGTAFLSIPISMEALGLAQTAVLSVCTERPLDETAYHEWMLLAGVLFRPLVEEEMGAMIKRLDFAEAAYSIGHPLKNRTMPLASTLKQLDREIRRGQTTERLRFLVRRAEGSLDVIKNIGHILDCLSRSMKRREGERVFLEKAEWFVSAMPYVVSSQFVKISEVPLPPECVRVGKISFDPQECPIEIVPWIQQEDGVLCRPSDLFYDEIFQELIINATRHSQVQDVELRISCQEINLAGAISKSLVVSNYCAQKQTIRSLSLVEGEWQKCDTSTKRSVGGLPILTTFMEITGFGKGVFVRFVTEGDGVRFFVALPLKNLNGQTPQLRNGGEHV